MAAAAESRGDKGRYAVTLSRSIYEPFTTLSERRDLREKAYRGFIMRGENGGEKDNGPVVAEMLALRAEKARLLGYESYAALKLDDTMAKTPAAVLGLLEPVWEKAREKAAADQNDLQRIAISEGHNHPIAGWDWRHYQEKLRAEKFAFDEAELKPYPAAGADHRGQLRRRHPAVRHHLRGEARRRDVACRCAGVRGGQAGRFDAGNLRRRLFRAAAETLGCVDELAGIGLQPR